MDKYYDFHGRKFSVTEDGHIFYTDGRKSGCELRQHENADGYMVVTLFTKNGSGKLLYSTRERVHRIVATVFVENPNGYNEVNHKDFNRKNNHYSNLEWTTHTENIKYSFNAGRCFIPNWEGINNPKSKLNVEQNKEILEMYENGKSAREIYRSEKFPVSETRIEQICQKSTLYQRPKYLSNKIEMKTKNCSMEFDSLKNCVAYLKENTFIEARPSNLKRGILRSMSSGKKFLGINFYRK